MPLSAVPSRGSRVAVIGAGVAGLSTAKVLTQAGHLVTVFDKAPDVGGVWSRTRRYPGVTTQSPKEQYALSDYPMPADFPEWPTGAQIQEYLAGYAAHFGLERLLRLDTEVSSVVPAGDGWRVTTAAGTERVDRVVVANGVFCEPSVPEYAGLAEFTAAGGRLCAGSEFNEVEQGRDKHVLVVGYGKTACDIAVATSGVAASTSVVARQLLWKIPRRIAGVLNFKLLLLTRLGEALFRYLRLRGFEKFLHGPGDGPRRRLLNSLGPVSVRQLGLGRLDLVPRGSMEDIVRGAIGLVTEGFFEQVADGRIAVHKDTTIVRLSALDGKPYAELANGTRLPADLVVCATGYTQGVPFLPEAVRARVLDERGNFALYRQIQPVDVPGLYFNGYNSSFFSPLNAEMAAVWIAADLAGLTPKVSDVDKQAAITAQLAFMDEATSRHRCRGTKIIPFSIHNVDEMLDDLDLNLGRATRFRHWLNPVNPAAYRDVTPRLLSRLASLSPAEDPALEKRLA
ncbi:glycine/D-amino acid oxidase-like deaminating enzyme [Crossiella equi]|uniref:Glycine/D-amino acid oxidase-like deaminating enzyme n=1 Tax=Crossiella equi TaxID=130796 RepID=A0ABS5A7A6_9PSEU|nr:NAD(P)/FAD-dependent oxidoreductase [Crossiella equi]MBP2472485.1 glycine/D-amino acid oxidase-like deaminating enzyme [Crossiella equi]